MSRRISAHLAKWCLTIIFYYAFVLGLLPGPLNRKLQKFRNSSAYLVYSALIQCAFLALSPLGTPILASREEKNGVYMLDNVILEWTYYAAKIARILTIVVLSLVTWLRRQSLIDLYESYRGFVNKYEAFCCRYSVEKEIQTEVNTTRRYTIYKFCTTHGNGLIITTLLLLLQDQPGGTYDSMVLINFLQTFFLLVGNVNFCVTLSYIHLHFVYINKSLEMLMLRKCSRLTVVRRCWTLYSMHFDCYQLSKRILKISRPLTLCMMAKIFITNIAMLFHAVQFANGTIVADKKDNMVGILSIVFFYWDAILIMIAIDNILTSCNRTAFILSNISSLHVKEGGGKCHKLDFTKMYLACHKLKFYIFGLFPINKATCLQYFFSALVHVIILIQYDLKLRS